ncbi:MAG: carbohydrate ABC transporter permease [Lachnospiraceae bacterium]|nr:carbohydrate ABC transporter permease [Lachnospiraceae bacterium]
MITKNKAFIIVQYVFVAFLVICCIVPFWLLIASSFTPESVLTQTGYSLIPKQITFETYEYLWAVSAGVGRAYLMSVIIAAIGVTSSIIMTTFYAYPLSRKDLPGRNIISFFLFFTMLFNGGLVPTYIVYTRLLHIKDTLWAMIVPGMLMNAFHVIMMRTYITSNISDEIIEAGRIDGANELTCLIRIVIPLCKPIMGTLALMTFIAYWNNWTNGVYYIQDRKDLFGIQNYMKNVLDSINVLQQQVAKGINVDVSQIPSVGIRMALAVVGVLPVLVIYPFFQKSFVKGVTLGSVKG